MLPLPLIVSAVGALVKGPLSTILDRYVGDLELRRKLKAELEQELVTGLSKEAEQAASVIIAETKSEDWLTRNWRPVLMLSLLGLLMVVGIVIPSLELLAGHPIAYQPRWQALPPEFWSFLSIGMGGYIGGRSLEKVAREVFGARAPLSPKRR
ncbi:MAG: 3TM-type holin [Aestuariivirga sp.]